MSPATGVRRRNTVDAAFPGTRTEHAGASTYPEVSSGTLSSKSSPQSAQVTVTAGVVRVAFVVATSLLTTAEVASVQAVHPVMVDAFGARPVVTASSKRGVRKPEAWPF
jgi:hypothetical protein